MSETIIITGVIYLNVDKTWGCFVQSLQQFCYEKECGLAVRFDLNRPSIQKVNCEIITKTGKKDVAFTLISLPLYMVEEMPGILKRYFSYKK